MNTGATFISDGFYGTTHSHNMHKRSIGIELRMWKWRYWITSTELSLGAAPPSFSTIDRIPPYNKCTSLNILRHTWTCLDEFHGSQMIISIWSYRLRQWENMKLVRFSRTLHFSLLFSLNILVAWRLEFSPRADILCCPSLRFSYSEQMRSMLTQQTKHTHTHNTHLIARLCIWLHSIPQAA